MNDGQGQLTGLLQAWRRGDEGARDRLAEQVYVELRRLAAGHLRRESPGTPLQPTELVNETFLRLIGLGSTDWQGRAHFFGIASRLMRQVLVDHARTRRAEKRGGAWRRITLDEAAGIALCADEELLALDMALDRLATQDEKQARIVEMRFFGGLTTDETAEVLRLSPASVKREWSMARAWLFRATRAPFPDTV